ncbi:centlein isoform X3 [Chiroxiphia lanceolata]|uniref:centlein isoform X3 n=1 Tax=Chiroxiphia lanceolata TaxID=296741 RepID=UPI0013CE4B40|nr:centlein isoform X3 [Chiroxiphia lanceolata]XP_032530955.1 centlein isoform X3 [Chiroxiphia lanceolata]XP_032530956.1 centlein isoform X3 [Chiroxiphia lanceolata]
MTSWGVEAAARQVAELEEELRGLAEELSSCQAEKEFVWSLWKHLQASSPDLIQAVGLVVEREKQKAEIKDRRVLELLETKDSKIETLEQKQKEKVEGEEKLKSVRLTGQHQEINNLMQRKNAVEEENACLKNEFSTLNQKFKDKSQELKDTEECAQKKEEQNRLVIKNLEEENKGLNTCCADLLSDLEKLRKQEAQWKMEKSGSDAIIKNLKTDLAEAREQIKELRSICGNLSSQVAVKQEELFQKNCDVIKAKKELQELQNLCGQNTEYTAQQTELIKQVQALNANTQKVMKDQEDAHTAEITLYQKLYNELSLCFETVKTSETQLQQSCASLQDHLLEKDKTICLLQVQLQEAHNASNAIHQNSSPKYQVQEPPVKRSRSLSPKSSFRESEELRKLKIAERKIENLEKTLQLKTRETDELRAAYEKHKERLQMLQTNYRALKEQLKQWEEGDTRHENSKSGYQHADSCQLCQEDPDVVWNELAFFKREHKKLFIEKLNLEEELDQMKIHQSVGPLFKLSEDDGVKNNTPVRNMREVSHQMLQKMQQLERRFNAVEGELRKQKEVNKDLLNQKIYLKESLKVQKEDADTRERELEMLLKRICEIKKEKSELQLVIDEKEKEVASLKRQVAEANRLRSESEDLLSQVQEPKCLPDKAKAVTTSGQCNCKITGTKVKLKTAKEKSSLGHHGAFLKQSIKVMSNVFEKLSKDGWEDVNGSSDSEIPNSESLETVIMKTVQNIDPLPDRSKQEKKSCNTVHLKGKTEQYNKKCHSQNKDLEKLCSKRRKICCLVTSHPSILSKVNRAKRRNITVQKPGYSVTLLQERIKSLQKQIAVLQNEKKTAVASVKEMKETKEKLTNQLHLANQRLQTSKLTIEMLTSNLAKWQQEKEDLQGKLKLREHLSQTAGKSKATPAPSKNIDLEMKQLQCKLKSSNNEITKQSTTIKSLKNEVQEKEERIRELQAKISRLERDFTTKRHLIEDLKSHLKASQENEKTSNETLESLERKVKALAEDCSGKKTSIHSLKQRLDVATKEKSQYEQMYHKAKDELEKKDLKLTKLESKMIETECAMTKLETAASDQLHSLAKQSAEALETIQKKLLLTSDKVEEFKTFVKTLSRELQHSIQELRTKIKKAKKVGKMKACKNCPSQESVQLAASILNVSTTDLEEILDVEDEEETAKTKMEFEKDKEWLQCIQRLMEAQVSTHCLSSDHTHILTRAQAAAHTHHCNSSPVSFCLTLNGRRTGKIK